MRSIISIVFVVLSQSASAGSTDPVMTFLRTRSLPDLAPQVVEKAEEAKSVPTVGLVFPADDKAQIIVFERKADGHVTAIAESKEFGFYRTGNWISSLEDFSSSSPDRFSLTFSFRNSCARGTNTYRFAYRHNRWVSVGLDDYQLRCTEGDEIYAEKTTYNFLTGKAEFTRFDTHDKVVERRTYSSADRPYPLQEFPPETDQYEAVQ